MLAGLFDSKSLDQQIIRPTNPNFLWSISNSIVIRFGRMPQTRATITGRSRSKKPSGKKRSCKPSQTKLPESCYAFNEKETHSETLLHLPSRLRADPFKWANACHAWPSMIASFCCCCVCVLGLIRKVLRLSTSTFHCANTMLHAIDDVIIFRNVFFFILFFVRHLFEFNFVWAVFVWSVPWICYEFGWGIHLARFSRWFIPSKAISEYFISISNVWGMQIGLLAPKRMQ